MTLFSTYVIQEAGAYQIISSIYVIWYLSRANELLQSFFKAYFVRFCKILFMTWKISSYVST